MINAELKRGSSVLVVDDEPMGRDLLKRHISQMGYKVVVATSAREALETLREEPNFAGLITDIQMPDLDGIDLLKQVRYYRPYLPVLVVTGHIDPEEYRKQLNALGVNRLGSKLELKQEVDLFLNQNLHDHHYDARILLSLRSIIKEAVSGQDSSLQAQCAQSAFLRFGPEILGDIAVVVTIYGSDLNGTLVFGGPMIWWSRLAKGYLGSHANTATALYDCAGEFANKAASKVREHFFRRGLDSSQSPQMVLRGKRVELLTQYMKPALVVPFSAEDLSGDFYVEFLVNHKSEDREPPVELADDGDMVLF